MSLDAQLIRVRVASVRDEAAGIRSFTLCGVDTPTLPPFDAGAHIDVHLEGGLVRQYSLCGVGGPEAPYVVAVLHAPASRGGSRAMHSLTPGDVLSISPPRNHFALQPQPKGAPRPLLIAGGIGVTPLMAMMHSLADQGSGFELHYAARSRSAMAFRDDVLELVARDPSRQVAHLHFDDGDPSQRLALEPLLAAQEPDTHLYVCGPQGLIDAVLQAARDRQWPEARLHFEYFGAVVTPEMDPHAFDVRVASSGRVFRIAKDRSITQTLADGGIEIPVSCEQGVCGTCLTGVLEGEPDHRDHYLSEAERAASKLMLPCCSRSKSRVLVLDL